MLRDAIDAGYDVRLIYIGVANAALSARRVDQRIALGGHDVPRDRIASRFARSLDNLAKAIKLGLAVELYDNSSADYPYRQVATFVAGRLTSRMKGSIPRWARGVIPAVRRRR